MSVMTTTRTVVTGLSVAAPNGLGVADYWAATLAGRSGIPLQRLVVRTIPPRYRTERQKHNSCTVLLLD